MTFNTVDKKNRTYYGTTLPTVYTDYNIGDVFIITDSGLSTGTKQNQFLFDGNKFEQFGLSKFIINSNTVLANKHNNSILEVRDNVTITITSGLLDNFVIGFEVNSGFTANFALGGDASYHLTPSSYSATAGKKGIVSKKVGLEKFILDIV